MRRRTPSRSPAASSHRTPSPTKIRKPHSSNVPVVLLPIKKPMGNTLLGGDIITPSLPSPTSFSRLKLFSSWFCGTQHTADWHVVGAVFLTHASLFLYALGFWIGVPVIPQLTRELGGDQLTYGNLQSTVAFFQLLGSPIMGRILDTHGARTGLVLSHLSGASVAFSISNSYTLDGVMFSSFFHVLSHGMLCAQSAIVVISDRHTRASALGRIGLSYGLGMMMGGPLGGYISSNFSSHVAMRCASCMFLFGAALTRMTLPPLISLHVATSSSSSAIPLLSSPPPRKTRSTTALSSPPSPPPPHPPLPASSPTPPHSPSKPPTSDSVMISDNDAEMADNHKSSSSSSKSTTSLDLAGIIRVLHVVEVRNLVLFSFLVGQGISQFRAMFSFAAVQEFELSAQDLGIVMSVGAALGLCTNLLVVGPLTSWMGDNRALATFTWITSWCFACIVLFESSVSFVEPSYRVAVIVVLAVCSMAAASGMYTLSSSAMSHEAPAGDMATGISLQHGTRSATGILAPVFGGLIMKKYGFSGVCFFSSCFTLTGSLFLISRKNFDLVRNSPRAGGGNNG